jgi:amino acid transporter
LPLKRSLGLIDVALYVIIAGSNLQWVATAAASGPSSFAVWIIGLLAMFVPIGVAVVYLTTIYPDEGGMYIWSKRVFGRFAGFMTGWTYWTTNLPFFPALLYFMVGNALFLWPGGAKYATSAPVFIWVSLLGLAFGSIVNYYGLDVGKWLNNVGAVARWSVTLILIVVGVYSVARFGAATHYTLASLAPTTDVKSLIFWSIIAFAWVGPESVSFMAGEIKNPQRNIPLGFLIAAPVIAIIYLAGTFSVLGAVTADKVDPLYGVMQSISATVTRLGWGVVTPIAAALVAISCLASVGAWLGSVARIPFVAGLDKYLPPAFGSMHPTYHSPVASIIAQFVASAIVVFIGQAGASVHVAYELLVDMMVLVTMVPFLFMFSAAIFVKEQPEPGTVGIPGGRLTVVIASILGLFTTAASMVLSAIPAADDPNKPLAVAKVVGLTAVVLAAGALVYRLGGKQAGTVE